MPRKNHAEGQRALVVRELENGAKVEDLYRKLGGSEATVYNWRELKTITVDNGSEFTPKELDTWSYLNEVTLDFIRPGKPVENCYIESLKRKLRDECLNMNLFFPLAQVEQTVADWLHDYNHVRPHR